MPLPTSSLSQACRAIADFISTGINASANSIRIMIGNPADAVPAQSENQHRLNLFFYLIEPSGFFPDTHTGDCWWIKLKCLITGFGLAEEQISSGENDLRLLGEVIRLFHENPVLNGLEIENENFLLQVIFQPLNPDDLNHIWSTQGDVSYRPSVAYEMSLLPVIPKDKSIGSPLVGVIGSEVRGMIKAKEVTFSGDLFTPMVAFKQVDPSLEDWAPAICLIHGGQCVQSLSFARDSDTLENFTPGVWVAGRKGSAVTLVWEKWTSKQGWQRQSKTEDATAVTSAINPAETDSAVTFSIDLPFTEDEVGQAVLYAERTYTRVVDGHMITVRSNPVMVTIYEETK
jgi:hypothetical protein